MVAEQERRLALASVDPALVTPGLAETFVRAIVAQRVNGSHPAMSGGHPAGRRPESGVPDLTGPDLTGPDRTEPTSTPQPPPPQAEEGERNPRRGRRTRDAVGDPFDSQARSGQAQHVAAPPPEVPLEPLAPADVELWGRAAELLRADMSTANWELLVEPLEPLGRAPDGGLWLRAPPGQGVAGRVATVVKRALLDEGEQQAAMARIVEQ